MTGAGVAQLTFEGHAIRSKVKIARRPFRRQAESLFTSLYEAEAVLHGDHGSLLMSVPIGRLAAARVDTTPARRPRRRPSGNCFVIFVRRVRVLLAHA